MVKPKILVIDDEKNICRSMKMILSSEGYPVFLAENTVEAWSIVRKNVPDIIFLDVLLPGEDGMSFLPKIKVDYPDIEVVMISGHANLSMAVEATRAGAYDFLEKPLQKEKILLTISHIMDKRNLTDKYNLLAQEKFDDYQMIGESRTIKNIRKQIDQVAPTESKVLILGESGTGKELVAWAIHHQSPRKDKPFVRMNCAAIPEDLTESELFGYEKGAFTGAIDTRDGKFLLADGGTIFLDEIADMSLKVQTKVLRVLQDGQFERVGGNATISVNARVIAATNKDVETLVKQGEFREDLYYRLNVFPIIVPPLRQRGKDISLLMKYFVNKYCQKNNRKVVQIDPPVIQTLNSYTWPGNIRELQNVIERLLILNPGKRISLKDLPANLFQMDQEIPSSSPGKRSLKEVRELAEREYILKCLEHCNGNVSEAAGMLGIERTNLHKKMKALRIRS